MTRSNPDDPKGADLIPRAPRHSVMLNAIVKRFGRPIPSRHRVRDLSSGGVRIDQAIGFTVGATVMVTVGALQSVGATVVWVKDGSAGLRFTQAVEVDEVRANAAIAPRILPDRGRPSPGATAGWVPERKDAYRKG
jgi:hypothetical protein